MNRSGQTTALSLPDGGVLEVPLPGGKGRFSIRPPSLLAAADGSSRLPIIIGVVVGVAVGVAATAWYMSRR
jgi:hypothetical protein